VRAVLQRVSAARVSVAGEDVGAIDSGLLVLLAVAPSDGPDQVRWLAHKIATLRIFSDAQGKMNRSVQDDDLAVLVVSQFTLYGDTSRGRRPSFASAAPPAIAKPLYEALCDTLSANGLRVQRGRFGADMAVDLTNDGPVTLVIDTPALTGQRA